MPEQSGSRATRRGCAYSQGFISSVTIRFGGRYHVTAFVCSLRTCGLTACFMCCSFWYFILCHYNASSYIVASCGAAYIRRHKKDTYETNNTSRFPSNRHSIRDGTNGFASDPPILLTRLR